MSYLVMECREAYAVVLSDEGEFLKVANLRYEVGQTVTDVVRLNLPKKSDQPGKAQQKRWISALSAVAACLVLMITSLFVTGQRPYASVYMTINPEVRIDVNQNDAVVGVEGINQDGMTLLEGYDHRKKDLDTVMDELVDRAIDMGYLHEGDRITLSLDADETWVTGHEEHLNTHLNEHLTDRITVTIDITQKQPIQTDPAASTGDIVLPVDPDSYGDSDYGEDAVDSDDISDDDGSDGDSEYASGDDGQTDYEEPDTGDSFYDATDDGQSDDTEPDEGDSAYGQAEATEDSQTDYVEPDTGDSSYDATDDGQWDDTEPDDGDSAYEEPEEEDAESEDTLSDEEDSDEEASDYEESDEEASDYEESDEHDSSEFEEDED